MNFLFIFNVAVMVAVIQFVESLKPSTEGYACQESGSYPCRAYAYYTATSPKFLDLGSIGDLFSISRLSISVPSNISHPNVTLSAGQPLLVPLTCTCTNSTSYSPINVTIVAGDTFYLLSTLSFLNLTTYQSVELVNPTLVPTNLDVGVTATFPIFCMCSNLSFAISYVLQPSDTLSSVSLRFGSNLVLSSSLNPGPLSPFDTVFLPVDRLPTLPTRVTPPSPSPPIPTQSSNDHHRGTILGLGLGLGFCGVALVLMSMGLLRKERMPKKGREEDANLKKLVVGFNSVGNQKEDVKFVGVDVADCLDKYRVYVIEELKVATNGFDRGCLIQGSVYRGSIGGEIYAIKKMKWNACEELKILQKVNHGNLVKLEGFCIDPDDANCYLVYEHVENGSLHSWLHCAKTTQKLSWKTRLTIAIDVANGLLYIHEHTRPRVVHKDIKSTNVLLDSNMHAKIANFGLAKSGCNAITMHIVGTQGYIAPEYLADGVISTKMDVYAFGVVLLELLSGREAVDGDGEALCVAAPSVLEGTLEEKLGKLMDWVDEVVKEDSCPVENVMSVMTIAVACLHKNPAKRPSMVDIAYALCKSDDDAVFDISESGLSGCNVVAR